MRRVPGEKRGIDKQFYLRLPVSDFASRKKVETGSSWAIVPLKVQRLSRKWLYLSMHRTPFRRSAGSSAIDSEANN